MHRLLLPHTMPLLPSSSSTKPLKCLPPNPNSQNSSSSSSTTTTTTAATVLCKHCPSATLDLLILILVLFSGAFLLISYFSYLFHSLSLLFSHYSFSSSSAFSRHLLLRLPPASYIFGFLAFFVVSILLAEFCCGSRSRRCSNSGCKGLKKARQFDLQLQTEECVKSGGAVAEEIDRLPWKGGNEGNPDYECLRAELRKMAPPNGRAVLLFRSSCGCPVAKLEGWGPNRGRRHKRALSNVAANGDHR